MTLICYPNAAVLGGETCAATVGAEMAAAVLRRRISGLRRRSGPPAHSVAFGFPPARAQPACRAMSSAHRGVDPWRRCPNVHALCSGRPKCSARRRRPLSARAADRAYQVKVNKHSGEGCLDVEQGGCADIRQPRPAGDGDSMSAWWRPTSVRADPQVALAPGARGPSPGLYLRRGKPAMTFFTGYVGCHSI